MANNCHFMYADVCSKEGAEKLLKSIKESEDFNTCYLIRTFTAPVGARVDVEIFQQKFFGEEYTREEWIEEMCDNDDDKTRLEKEMVMLVIDGWNKWTFPEALLNSSDVFPLSMWQVEGDEELHFLPDGYDEDVGYTESNMEDYFNDNFECKGNKVYFKFFHKLLRKIGSDTPAPYYTKLPLADLEDERQTTHLYTDKTNTGLGKETRCADSNMEEEKLAIKPNNQGIVEIVIKGDGQTIVGYPEIAALHKDEDDFGHSSIMFLGKEYLNDRNYYMASSYLTNINSITANGIDVLNKQGKYCIQKNPNTRFWDKYEYAICLSEEWEDQEFHFEIQLKNGEEFDPKKFHLINLRYEFPSIPCSTSTMRVKYDGVEYGETSDSLDLDYSFSDPQDTLKVD